MYNIWLMMAVHIGPTCSGKVEGLKGCCLHFGILNIIHWPMCTAGIRDLKIKDVSIKSL